MRLALLSDIHGNRIALDAVLADAQSMHVEGYWILGDLVAIGPEPVAVLERLTSLDNIAFVRGNTDRYVITGEAPPPTIEEATARPELVDQVVQIHASFAWTCGIMSALGWFDWLASLPLEQRMTLPDGTHLLGVHAAPGCDDGEGIHPGCSNAEVAQLTAGCGADLICVGHTHQPMDRRLGAVRIVNLGSVSNPHAPDLRASYVILDATPSSSTLFHRRVPYDHQAVIDTIRRSHHPAGEYIISFQLGQHPGRAPHPEHPKESWLV